jgi:hypothetical protein
MGVRAGSQAMEITLIKYSIPGNKTLNSLKTLSITVFGKTHMAIALTTE